MQLNYGIFLNVESRIIAKRENKRRTIIGKQMADSEGCYKADREGWPSEKEVLIIVQEILYDWLKGGVLH